MKKVRILALLMWMAGLVAQAQRFVVYALEGKVEVTAGSTGSPTGVSRPLGLRDELKATDLICIPRRGAAVVFDAKTSRQYTLKTPGKATLREMVEDKRNTIRPLAEPQAAYIRDQIMGDKQTLARDCGDPDAVTRDLCLYNTNPTAEGNDLTLCGDASFTEYVRKNKGSFDGFSDNIHKDFDGFVKDIHADFEQFRKDINQEFIAFVRQPWESVESETPKPLPKDEEVKPKPIPETDRRLFARKPDKLPAPKVVEPKQEEPVPQPEPFAPLTPNKRVTEYFDFETFGTRLRVRLGDAQHFHLASVIEEDVANALERLTAGEYENALCDCLSIREEHRFSDWAYFDMLKDLGNAFCGEGSNEATLLTAYLLQQSGYMLRFGRAEGKLYILPHTNYMLYGVNYFHFSDGNFFVLDGDIDKMDFCNVPFHAEKPFSLHLPHVQQYDRKEDEPREIRSKHFPDLCLKIRTNRNLIDFYNTYPSSELGENMMTRWAMYANTEPDPHVMEQIRQQLTPQLQGLSTHEKVSRLLDLCQTGLTYEYDKVVWGYDRAFFAEETLHYPYADCEDRSIFFTRLVREFTGLQCVLIYYPGHLAAGVCFGDDQVSGDYVIVNGKRFVITDPTFVDGAPIGLSMRDVDHSAAQAIVLE